MRGRIQRLGARRRSFRDAWRDTGGATAVEFGLIIPLLSLMTVAVIDIGLAVHRKLQVENAAQVGAQYAIVNGFSAAAVTSAVTSATNATTITATPAPAQFCGCPSSAGINTVTCGTTCAGGLTAGTYVTVSAQATYSTLVNYQLVAETYTYSAQSTARLQ